MSAQGRDTFRDQGHPEALAFVAFGGWLFAMDPVSGRRVWYAPIVDGAGVMQYLPRVVVAGDRVVVGNGTTITCVDHSSGNVVWRTTSPVHATAMVVVAGVVMLGNNGEACGVALADGRVLWHDPFKKLGTGLTTIAAGEGASSPVFVGKGYA